MSQTRRPEWVNWLWAIVAVLPFFAVYLFHFLCREGTPTGFILYDQAVYLAHGRAVFERGNGLTYPNPYDYQPDSPAIYFHTPIWLLGAGVHFLGFDPGWWYVAWGIVFGVIFSRLTLALVEHCLGPAGRRPIAVFLLSMWGGGFFALAAMANNRAVGEPHFADLMQFDPYDGWWFLNWGRNLSYSTEATYHALVVWCWLSLLKKNWKQLLAPAALVAVSHPFTGAETLAVLLAWTAIGWIARLESRVPLFVAGGLCAIAAAFFGYYFVFLQLFGQHQQITNLWQKPMTLDLIPMLMAYGAVFTFALARVVIDWKRLPADTWFWLVAFAVAFLLAKHEWFMRPHQPLHFTRGYVWMPLFLLAAPLVDRGIDLMLRAGPWRAFRGFGAAVVAALAVADNVAFEFEYARRPCELGFYLSRAEIDLLKQMNARGIRGVLVSRDAKLSYLTPVYTPVRSYYGHRANTPDYTIREELVRMWFDKGTGAGQTFSEHDLVLVRRSEAPAFLNGPEWRLVLQNEGFLMYERNN